MRKIAESTVRRLSLYLRFLEEFEEEGTATVSSEALARRGGTTSAQVRKDLSFFGSFGKRGLGYSVRELADALRDILGLERSYNVAVVGAGKIGSALVEYEGFSGRGFHVRWVFDRDPEKIGSAWNGVRVQDVERLEAELRAGDVQIAIVATTADAAQAIADRLVAIGVKAILNFAPVQLSVAHDVAVKNVNMAMELETLSYALRNR